jgi:AcrR family transcriptional regulator
MTDGHNKKYMVIFETRSHFQSTQERRSLMAGLSAKKKAVLETLMRETLFSAAEKLIQEEGWKGATVERIAQEAGIAKGTVYNYFRDKREILSSLLERNTEDIRLFVRSLNLEKENPRHLLENILKKILDNLYEKRGLIAATIQAYYEDMDLRRDFEPHHKMQEKHPLWEVRSCIRKVIAKGVDTGDFSPVDPVMAETALNAIIMGVAKQFAMDMVDFPGEAYISTIRNLVMHGLSFDKKSS